MIDNNLLVHELQLGESLGRCVHSERRADFALMLAMLVDDAREFSQFKLPLSQPKIETSDDVQLRRQFELPSKPELALRDLKEIDRFNECIKIKEGFLTDLRLSSALTPKPLGFRDDKSFIPTQVTNNTSLFCQSRHKQLEKQQENRLAFNANEWLKTVNNTRMKHFIAAA